jgi:hypothetical protein
MLDQKDWKIWPPYEIFYIESLLTKTRAAIAGYELLDKVITDQKLFNENPSILIDLAENIINQAAAISRYLFPSHSEGAKNLVHKLRGEKLRESLLVEQENVLEHRWVRDYSEHFDERLDTYLTEPIAGNFLPSIVVLNSNELDEVTFVFRAYVVNEFKFICLEKQIVILPIVHEIYRIHNLLVDFKENGGRLK